MKEKFVKSSISLINKYQECDDLKLKKLKYGLEGLYSLIIKITAVIIIAFLTNSYKETLLFLLFYAGIRTFSFGIHAKSNISCWITTITIYNIIPLLIKNITIPSIINYSILILSFTVIILFAPADTPKRPLIKKNERLKCKIISTIIVSLYIIVYFLSNNLLIKTSIIYALLIQSILINPLTYKLTNTRFNNYKYYKKN